MFFQNVRVWKNYISRYRPTIYRGPRKGILMGPGIVGASYSNPACRSKLALFLNSCPNTLRYAKSRIRVPETQDPDFPDPGSKFSNFRFFEKSIFWKSFSKNIFVKNSFQHVIFDVWHVFFTCKHTIPLGFEIPKIDHFSGPRPPKITIFEVLKGRFWGLRDPKSPISHTQGPCMLKSHVRNDNF